MSIDATPPSERPIEPLDPRAARRILGIGLPIVGGMISQNVLDIVDTIMVGRLGEAALAAVGIGAFVNFMAVALLIGLAAGVQAIVARRRGEGRTDEMAIPLNGGLFVALIVAIPVSVTGILLVPTVYPWLVSGEEAVIAQGVPYVQARLAGALAIGLNFSFRGYWYGIGETGTYLKIIVTVHVINVLLSLVLIFGLFGAPKLGTLGAGIGTTAALYVGTVLYAVLTLRRARPHGFLRRLPRGQTFASLLRLSIPSAIQTFLFAAGLTALFTIAGTVGVTALAVSNIMVNLSKLAVLPAMGLGFAAMTLVSEALGRGAAADANRWTWQTVQLAVLLIAVVATTLIAIPGPVLSAFTTEANVVAAGVVPLRVVGAALLAEALAAVMTNALTGAGAARLAMLVNGGAQWLIGLPAAFLLATTTDMGVLGVWIGWSLFRLLSAGTLTVLWLNGFWRRLSI